ncbi:MAG TPA: hypothetical protein VFQ39_12355 [Longimicrobium sp.]|nr:hypothetical protein [Longimicrobium sp.]
MPAPKPKRLLALLAAALAAGACSLTETTTTPGEDRVVVEAVLRTDVARQDILLHRTLDGRFAGGVEGATVVVTDSLGGRFVFSPSTGCYEISQLYIISDSLEFQGSCYSNEPNVRWVFPGLRYDLRIELPDGGVIQGRTRVPGDFQVVGLPDTDLLHSTHPCSLAPDSTLPLVWRRSAGAWSYVAQMRIFGLRAALTPRGIDNAPDPFELRGLAVSATDTTILLPTEFGVFERLQYDQKLLLAIQNGLPEGTQAQLVIAAADRNWVNGVRGGSFNPSGQVRISSVVGDGVGVFGSLTARSAYIAVDQHTGYIRCGNDP